MIKCYTRKYQQAGSTIFDNETGEVFIVIECTSTYIEGAEYMITITEKLGANDE